MRRSEEEVSGSEGDSGSEEAQSSDGTEETQPLPPPRSRGRTARGVAATLAAKPAAKPSAKPAAKPSAKPAAKPSARVEERVRTPPGPSTALLTLGPTVDVPPREREISFSVCNTIRDIFNVPLLLFLSRDDVSRVSSANGYNLIIVGDEAINFHLNTTEYKRCRPLEVLVDINAPPGNTQSITNARITVFLDNIRSRWLEYLATYFGALDSHVRAQIEEKCACRLRARDGAFLHAELNERDQTVRIFYSYGDGEEETEDLVHISVYKEDVHGPKPRWVPYQYRLYGRFGYLVDRAASLKDDRNEDIAAKYQEQYDRLVENLDVRSFSQESIAASVKSYMADESKRRAQVTNQQQLLKAMIEHNYYPKQYEQVLTEALNARAINIQGLLRNQDSINRDFGLMQMQ